MKRVTTLLAATSAFALSSAMAGDITGKVTDSDRTVPLRGAEITVEETGQTVTSGRDGTFRLSGLDGGDYTLTVSYLGAADVSVRVSLPSADATQNVSVALGGEGDVLVVTGQRGSFNSALNQQRAADGVVTVLSADSVAQLPDENVAEAARRALGVSIANDQGEGRFITIRGINSQLNSTSINGVRMTSPESGDRRVALDVVDADVLKNIVISKTLSADMDGDAIGGAINIETISGLDREDSLLKIKTGAIYTGKSEEWGEKVSGTYADNFADGRFGVALSGSYQSRQIENDNKEVDGGWNVEEVLPFPEEELEMRNYDVERERLSLAANFDYMATENTKLYLQTLFNKFGDQEYRHRVEVKVEDAIDNGDIAFDTANEIVNFSGDDLEIDRDIKDRYEEQRIWSAVTGFEHATGVWSFDGSVSFTHAEEEEPNALETNFDQDIEEVLGIDVSDTMRPRLANIGTNYLDASGYEMDAMELTDGLSTDEELALTFNAKRDFMFGSNPGFLKAGVKSRLRDKEYELDFYAYEYEGDDDTLAMFLNDDLDYPIDVLGPHGAQGALRDFFHANRDTDILVLDEEGSLEEAGVSSYEASEDVLAGYVMGQVDIDNLRITAGVRVEQTDVEATGNIFDEDTVSLTPVTVENNYTDVLPSIAARWAVRDDVIVRASYYASLVRPNFGQFVPAGTINDDLELEAGNPDLERTEADNFDLLVEYYPTDASIFQAGIFYKELENLITSTTSDTPGVYNGRSYEEIETFTNLDEGTIFGVEVGYQQALEFLPAPWDGVLVGANYTYADSEAELEDGTKIEIPGQSEHIFNAIVGYDKGPLELRAAYSFKGENVDDVDVDGVGEGRIVLDQSFLDLSGKYRITDTIRVYADVKNVLDTELEIANRYGDGHDYLSQFEEYGRTYQAGLQFKF